jgi:hypothetical protein
MKFGFHFALTLIFGFAFFLGCGSSDPAPPSLETPKEQGSALPQGKPFQKDPEEIWAQQLSRSQRNSGKGMIRAVSKEGKAEISVDNGITWHSPKVGMTFRANTVLRTDAGASLDFALREDGPAFRMGPGSMVRTVRMEAEYTGIEIVTEDLIELEQGRLIGWPPKIHPASVFLIRTHHAVFQPSGKFDLIADQSIEADGGWLYADGVKIPLEKGEKILF